MAIQFPQTDTTNKNTNNIINNKLGKNYLRLTILATSPKRLVSAKDPSRLLIR